MNNTRRRKWLLTINKKAQCFEFIGQALDNIISKNDKYAYILHDKDNERQPHYHLMLTFKNPRSLNALKNNFTGAHIEPIIAEGATANYLTHSTENAQGKYQYSIEQVITNDKEWYLSIRTDSQKETFTEDKLPYYIYVRHLDTYLQLCLIFGASQLPYGIAHKLDRLNQDFAQLMPEEREMIINNLIAEYGEPDLPF